MLRTAGNWLFCNRRWLNPIEDNDRVVLEDNYLMLCKRFPPFASCTQKHFLQCLRDVCTSWSERSSEKCLGACTSPDCSMPSSVPLSTVRNDDERHSTHTCAANTRNGQIESSSSSGEEEKPVHLREATSSSIKRTLSASAGDGSGRDLPNDQPAKRSKMEEDHELAQMLNALAYSQAWPLNAGETVDKTLFEHWVSIPCLRIDPNELEHFGRSSSF